MKIKTRFAPSPTGGLHFGNIRTALYTWLFARNQGGKFILRIEDTNTHDCIMKNNSVDNIINSMKWLHLDWDEGPYFQSNRFDRYNSIINDMLERKIAYKCFCSSNRLDMLRKNQMKNQEKPKYDGHCRITRIIPSNNLPYVVRFRNPSIGNVIFHDQIRGIIKFSNQELDDLVIRRANGIPTYNFCVVVDDMDMNITHVIRGEEHINNTPRQINILKTLNAPIPIYAHVPIILDQDGKKISKRYGNLEIMQYRENGFLPEALLNYLVRLGWSYGNQEIFNLEQMKKYFSISNINKSPSILNLKKLLWLNRYYINHLPIKNVESYLHQYIQSQNIDYANGPKLSDIVRLFSKGSNTLKEIIHNCLYLYKDFNINQKKLSKKYLTSIIINPLNVLKKKLNNINNWTENTVKYAMSETIHELDMSISTIGMSLRVALTGRDRSPELSVVMYVMGKNRVLNRIDQALSYIIEN